MDGRVTRNGRKGGQWAEGAKEGTGFGGGLLAQFNCFHPQNDS